MSNIILVCSISCQEVPARPRSPSQSRSARKAKKSQPGREIQAWPRSPSQAKKFQTAKKSQPGQEVPAKPRCFRKPRSPSQTKKSQPSQEVPKSQEVPARPRSQAKSRSPEVQQGQVIQKGQKVKQVPGCFVSMSLQEVIYGIRAWENRYSHTILIPWGIIERGKMNILTPFLFPGE